MQGVGVGLGFDLTLNSFFQYQADLKQFKEYAKITEQIEEKKVEAARIDEQAECANRLLKHREEPRSQVEAVIDELDEQFQEKNAALEQKAKEIFTRSEMNYVKPKTSLEA